MESAATAAPTTPARPRTVFAGRNLSTIISEVTEALAAGATIVYLLGILRVVGDLQPLGLSTATVLSGFSHGDVMMSGIGLLISHLVASIILVGLVATLIHEPLRSSVAAALSGPGRWSARHIAAAAVIWLGMLFASRWWEGTALVCVVGVWLLLCWLLERAPSMRAVLAMTVLATASIGIGGAILNPAPLMQAHIAHDAGEAQGLLLGQSANGTWYVAVEDAGDYHLEVVAASGADRMRIEPPIDDQYETLARLILDGID